MREQRVSSNFFHWCERLCTKQPKEGFVLAQCEGAVLHGRDNQACRVKQLITPCEEN